jgi:hypothetical protein
MTNNYCGNLSVMFECTRQALGIKFKHHFFTVLFAEEENIVIRVKIIHTQCLLYPYCLLLYGLYCCYVITWRVVNKTKGKLHSKENYQ